MNCISSKMQPLLFLCKSLNPMTCYFIKGLLGTAVIVTFMCGFYTVPGVEHKGSCRRF